MGRPISVERVDRVCVECGDRKRVYVRAGGYVPQRCTHCVGIPFRKLTVQTVRPPKSEPFIPEPNSGCWLWIGAIGAGGYGKAHGPTHPGGKRVTLLAHRLIYEKYRGSIPGLTLDHLCRVRSCVNPAHLEPVSGGENTLRGESFTARHARSVACPRGHLYDIVESNGGRGCRVCRLERYRRYQMKKKRNTEGP